MMEKVYIEIDASPWLDAEGNIEISIIDYREVAEDESK